MPNKGHRAASRQAQLKRKRRRGKGPTQELALGPTQPRAVTADKEPLVEEEPQPAVAVGRPALSASVPVRRPRQRAAPEPAPASRFLGGELRKIGLITTLIFAILAVLTVFLRG